LSPKSDLLTEWAIIAAVWGTIFLATISNHSPYSVADTILALGVVLVCYMDYRFEPRPTILEPWISAVKSEIEACQDELTISDSNGAPIPAAEWIQKTEQERMKALKDRYPKVRDFYDELDSRNERMRGLSLVQIAEIQRINLATRHKARLALNALK
jgi:hypothetical protein